MGFVNPYAKLVNTIMNGIVTDRYVLITPDQYVKLKHLNFMLKSRANSHHAERNYILGRIAIVQHTLGQ